MYNPLIIQNAIDINGHWAQSGWMELTSMSHRASAFQKCISPMDKKKFL